MLLPYLHKVHDWAKAEVLQEQQKNDKMSGDR